jgi:hypothetical protein
VLDPPVSSNLFRDRRDTWARARAAHDDKSDIPVADHRFHKVHSGHSSEKYSHFLQIDLWQMIFHIL